LNAGRLPAATVVTVIEAIAVVVGRRGELPSSDRYGRT